MENEQEVIKALGSPEQVAKIVKDGLGDRPRDTRPSAVSEALDTMWIPKALSPA